MLICHNSHLLLIDLNICLQPKINLKRFKDGFKEAGAATFYLAVLRKVRQLSWESTSKSEAFKETNVPGIIKVSPAQRPLNQL